MTLEKKFESQLSGQAIGVQGGQFDEVNLCLMKNINQLAKIAREHFGRTD